MYYLKYRPQNIREISNQKRRELLIKVFSKTEDIPHAWLFAGPKGTGKTSTARIIAKILNCENNLFANKSKSPEPCNKCISCRSIEQNRFFDVYELDAASNRGIDDVRALRDQVAYSPTKGRFKIYIIDEAHMLTKEAFNALLKTLEEPPKFVIFILATTEPQKLPATISSRCLVLNFQKAQEEEIIDSLEQIIKGEKIKVKPTVLTSIAQRAQGSYRDAAKLLELAVESTDLSQTQVETMLQNNVASNSDELLILIFNKEEDKALKWLDEFAKAGGNSAWLIEELLNLLHNFLLYKKGILNEDEIFSKLKQVKINQISRLIKLLFIAYEQTKYSPVDILPLMIVVVEYNK